MIRYVLFRIRDGKKIEAVGKGRGGKWQNWWKRCVNGLIEAPYNTNDGVHYIIFITVPNSMSTFAKDTSLCPLLRGVVMRLMTHKYCWGNNPKRQTLKGRKCRIIASGKMNSILVEFETGQRECVSRRAVR
ncbi:MAG: hypothetical protein K9N10_11205, partial [Deltaproteobacteria bacterium]|nr:hypothetical protein [Deltaproteobacteria bacterium]